MNQWKDISDLPPHMFEEIRHFFSVYKELEDKKTATEAFYGAQEAITTISNCMKAWALKQIKG